MASLEEKSDSVSFYLTARFLCSTDWCVIGLDSHLSQTFTDVRLNEGVHSLFFSEIVETEVFNTAFVLQVTSWTSVTKTVGI